MSLQRTIQAVSSLVVLFGALALTEPASAAEEQTWDCTTIGSCGAGGNPPCTKSVSDCPSGKACCMAGNSGPGQCKCGTAED